MRQQKQWSLADLASLTGSRLVGDPDYSVSGFADLGSAKAHDISFLSRPRYTRARYEKAMRLSQAGAIFIAPHISLIENKNFLIHEDPARAFQQTIEMMRGGIPKKTYFENIHPSAVIHETAQLGKKVTIGPNAVIDAHVSIDDNCFIGAGSYVGPHSSLGINCVIHPNVTIKGDCYLGDCVVVESGTTIGSCGFGLTTDATGKHTRLAHLGTVTIGDDVEIGANCAIDKARFTTTRIEQGTKIDSLVIIGHNSRIGKHTLICGQSGIAGSSEIGDHVIIGGQCGVNDHLSITDGVWITAKSGVSKSLKTQGKYGGIPVQPLAEYNRNRVQLRNIAFYLDKIEELKQRIEELEISLVKD